MISADRAFVDFALRRVQYRPHERPLGVLVQRTDLVLKLLNGAAQPPQADHLLEDDGPGRDRGKDEQDHHALDYRIGPHDEAVDRIIGAASQRVFHFKCPYLFS